MVSTNGHGSESERVALYMRVSSEEQKTKESIETQAGFLEEYCKLYGYDVAGVYKDEAISGTVPMRERPEGSRLLADAREGTLDAVLVYRLDRIGRSLLVVVDAHDRLGEAGVALKSANEPIDTSSPSGRLIFQMLASFAEFERATIAERSRDGLHRAFKNGKQLGRIPYGYDIAEDGTFVVVEEEASVVRRIIANIARGSTLYAEAKRLNDEGEPSPGTKHRGKPRKHGTTWCHSTIRAIVLQRAYSGTHVVNSSRGPIERSVPAIVDLDVYQRAAGRMAENKRYGGGRKHRNYLLRGLVSCHHCSTAYVGDASMSSAGVRYHYYAWRKKKATSEPLAKGLNCPKVKASWLEELIWADVRTFLQNPGEVLQRVREQLAEDTEGEDLEARHVSLTKRLAAKHEEKGRYAKLYAQGHLDEDELELHMADLKNQVGNLKLLISSVESDLAARGERRLVARTTEAWLLTLRKSLDEVEQETEDAFESRRELTKLLVERVVVGRDEEGRRRVDVTYRFGPPEQLEGVDSADGVHNSDEFRRAHGRGGAGGLLTGHPRMSSYSVAVERAPEASGSA
jgi:site-specific DNA recombinase